jgi:hypothetical protein
MPAESGSEKPSVFVVVMSWLCTAGVSYGAIHDIFIAHREAWWTSVAMAVGFLLFAVERTRKVFKSKMGPQ